MWLLNNKLLTSVVALRTGLLCTSIESLICLFGYDKLSMNIVFKGLQVRISLHYVSTWQWNTLASRELAYCQRPFSEETLPDLLWMDIYNAYSFYIRFPVSAFWFSIMDELSIMPILHLYEFHNNLGVVTAATHWSLPRIIWLSYHLQHHYVRRLESTGYIYRVFRSERGNLIETHKRILTEWMSKYVRLWENVCHKYVTPGLLWTSEIQQEKSLHGPAIILHTSTILHIRKHFLNVTVAN